MQYLCAGIITANVLNLFVGENETPHDPFDYVPGGRPPQLEKEDEDWIESHVAIAQLWAAQWNARQKFLTEDSSEVPLDG